MIILIVTSESVHLNNVNSRKGSQTQTPFSLFFFFFDKVYIPPSNYYSIDNVLPNFQFGHNVFPNYQRLLMFPNDENTFNKIKIITIIKKTKTKKKL
jgi:hypothetical protein